MPLVQQPLELDSKKHKESAAEWLASGLESRGTGDPGSGSIPPLSSKHASIAQLDRAEA